MITYIILAAAFVGVAALVGGVALFLRPDVDSRVEERLSTLTGLSSAEHAAPDLLKNEGVLASPLEEGESFYERHISGYFDVSRLLEQAGMKTSATQFLSICGGMGLVAAVGYSFSGLAPMLMPLVGLTVAILPLGFVFMKRKMRLKKFGLQLPEALELIARALRSGHSLAAGFQLVEQETKEPLGPEFGRVFEEQNLGIPIEEALGSLTDRVPNLDLKFFATSVVLQRQTGGDLAEILDKIGRLIRERIQIWGQVQALTGEGRLSGVVLLALPPLLFVTVYRMNPDYMKVLFEEDMGKKMLLGGVISQLIGAIVIKKIVNIKV